jgi:hypothetical protein
MNIFHDRSEHGPTLVEQARIEGVAGEAPGAKVFEDENPHDVKRETAFRWTTDPDICRHSLTVF